MECGGNYTDQAGVILSPNFPDNYPNDATCYWNITVALNQLIDFRFKRLDLDRKSNQGCLDSVTLYDGPGTRYPIIYGYYDSSSYYSQCGSSDESSIVNMTFRSTSNHLYVMFRSDDMYSRTGFSASYWAHECPPFKYGTDVCNNTCTCNQNNTLYCVNRNGNCACKSGWTSVNCTVDINECVDPNICEDPYSQCVNTPGSFVCQCKPGMIKNTKGLCEYANNCTEKNCSHACGVTSDNPRVETCFCPKGMKIDTANNFTCIDCKNWTYGENCLHNSQCAIANTQYYNKTNGLCSCYLNFTGTTCTQGANICWPKAPCSPTTNNAYCFNTFSSFECRCLVGYETLNDTFCDACGKIITALFGTIISTRHYRSSSGETQFSECSWIIRASRDKVVSLNFQKFSLWYNSDTYVESHPAYIEIYDGVNSSSKLLSVLYGRPDSSVPNEIIRASSNEMFIIQYTGYYDGRYGYLSGGFRAAYWTHECQPFTNGLNCTEPCYCVINNTQYCNSTNGKCVCKTGWTGTNCSVDIDECLQNSFACPDYSICQNTVGSFECKCKEGLTMTADKCIATVDTCTTRKCSHMCVTLQESGKNSENCYCPIGMQLEGDTCTKCKSNKYGPDCSRNCSCVQNNTLSCDTRTGECTCLPLWKGKNCSTDYDVCTPYSRNECQKYANCTDTGHLGYRCRCSQNDGYIESVNKSCVPINCTFVFTNATGDITSPLYPKNYMNNAFCTWSIHVLKGFIISLRFKSSLNLNYYECENDYIEVYDGENNESRPIGHYCENGAPSVIRTSGNKMYIIFRSNWRDNYGNLRGTYTSHACRSFTYGTDSCDKLCKCIKENTDFCDNVNGECICKPGWTMGDCSTDVDECLGTNNKVCPTNSDCINTKGSYRCECHLGYTFNTTTRTCDESNECLYKKCSHTCYIIGLGNEKCACPDGYILDTMTESVCAIPYYPYGKNLTDRLLSDKFTSYNTILGSSLIYFNNGVPYGNEIHTTAFILSNGVMGFGSRVVSFGAYQNLIDASIKKLNIVAPFMTNIDPFKGQVYYHLYEKYTAKLSSDESYRSPAMDAIIARAEKDIREYSHITDFEVSTVLVVTWAGVQPYGSNKSTEVNTFQTIYISGWESDNHQVAETAYVIFLYQYGLMNWDYLPGRPISIGTSGIFQNILLDLNTTVASVLDRVPGNTGYNGVMSFKVGHVTGPQQSCKKYLYDHANLLNDPVYQYEKEHLYKCPCTLERLGGQWQLFERRGPEQEIYCYAISIAAKSRLLRDNKRNMLCCYRWIKPSSNDWREWLQSWRDATYLPKSYESGHVLINDPWFWFPYFNYQALENIQTHRLCCRDSYSAQLCDQFYQIFPDDGCSNFVEFVPGWALGDPHLTTLDGLTYTMNGFGELVMMENPFENFTLQTRTGQAEAANGTLINATVFIAFAAKESNESMFQVELSASKTSLLLMANDIDITNDFYQENGPDIIVSTTSINVIKEYRNNKTMAIVNFPCGVTITVHVAVKSLLIEVNVPNSFKNKTKGLLGNFNGNKSDEFVLPDGTVLPVNLTERQIYQQFAKKWFVTSKNSVFFYRNGENTATYQHPDFLPQFGDELNQSQSVEAISICGDKNNACIFDYLITGDETFAQNTKDVSEESEIMAQNLDNTPPTLQVMKGSLDKSGRWLIKQSQLSILKIEANDEDNDLVTFEIVGSVTGVSINQTGHIHFIPDKTKPILLRVRAKDSKGSYSPFLFIPITICSACNGKGVCDNESAILEEHLNGWFQIQYCKCFPAYTGKECESELNACEINPCFVGQTCTDLTAEQQGNNSVGYSCGPCPNGYSEWNGSCLDIDECNTTKTCDGSCTNTAGSYICSCPDGYRLNMSDKKSCKDINECEERTSKCQHKCINNNGSFTCLCYSDYILDSDGQTCTLDPSKQSICIECQQVCEISGSNQVNCSCHIGYEVDPKDRTNCKDIDECQSGKKPCNHICVNSLGSYDCWCYTGFKLAVDQISCEKCESPYYGENCSNICQCNNRGTCDPVRGCVCNKQWTGVNCEIDANECTQVDVCSSGFVCENTIGSYKCQCPTGYKLENGICQDINECSEATNITCSASLEVCDNTLGSYRCVCQQGYFRYQNLCHDIDECTSNINNCEQMCINKPGTYNCQCYAGYILNDDRRTCKKGPEECTVKNMNCSYGCRKDSNNTAVCFCPQGFQVDGLGQCEDINECISDQLNLCTNKDGCSNKNGTYTCTCLQGSKLDNDKRTCISCSGETWGLECNNSCSCGLGSDHCDLKTGCVCKAGFTGILCDQDLDECQSGIQSCTSKEKCVNTPGSATCICLDGYKKENGGCQECDEGYFGPSCSQRCSCSINSSCNKTNGLCDCKAGWDGTNCDLDINECDVGIHNCNVSKYERCANVQGGYDCTCDIGYAKKCTSCECEDIDECSSTQTNKCQQLCENVSGSYKCSCKSGYFVSSTDTRKCEEINEYYASVTFNMNVDGRNLEDVNGLYYKRLKSDIEDQLVKKLKKKVSIFSLTVTKLRKGSLISDLTLLMNSDNLEKALNELLSDTFKLDNIDVMIIAISVNGTTVEPSSCLVRQILNPCRETEKCVVDNGITICQKKQEENLKVILGLTIGIPSFVLLCIVIVMIIDYYAKSHKIADSSKIENMQINQQGLGIKNPYVTINPDYQAETSSHKDTTEFPNAGKIEMYQQ